MYFDEEIAGLKVVELYDTKLTDPDALKEKFGVAKEEEIIAYIPNKNALTSLFSDVNFLITNKAAYKKKSVIGKLFSRNKSNVVFELEYLPEYVITATENSVNLCNLDKKIHFYDSGFFDSQEQSKSIAEDLEEFLIAFLKKCVWRMLIGIKEIILLQWLIYKQKQTYVKGGLVKILI